MALETIDLVIVGFYAIALFAIAILVSHEPAGHQKDTEDYFLAGKALPWWAIGASLIAANISAEQIIGQSGQGFVVGLAIAAYEWQAAIVLLIVAKFFLPIFLERKIFTMPQFLETRFGPEVKSIMAVFWIILYTAVNLTSILWLGGLAISAVTGWAVLPAMIGLAAFAVLYSLYGGLKAVAMTDIIQVVILILGGFAILWIALGLVGGEAGAMAGLGTLMSEIPGHFNMILKPDHPNYGDLPGIWTLLGGLWVLHFSYWGFNQYIIQRALGAESLPEAQKGLAFAAFLKLLIPIIVVIPGIATMTESFRWTHQPGAVPRGLRSACADGMSLACLTFRSGMPTPRREKASQIRHWFAPALALLSASSKASRASRKVGSQGCSFMASSTSCIKRLLPPLPA